MRILTSDDLFMGQLLILRFVHVAFDDDAQQVLAKVTFPFIRAQCLQLTMLLLDEVVADPVEELPASRCRLPTFSRLVRWGSIQRLAISPGFEYLPVFE